MKKIILFPLLCMCLTGYSQPQAVFMNQLNELEHTHPKELKGKFISESASGETYYECTKPLLGFKTFILQSNGTGKMIIRATPNKLAPLPPVLEKVLDQITRVATILGTVKKDSYTDAALKDYVLKKPQLKRVVVFTEDAGKSSTTFYLSAEGDYMVDIIAKD